MLDNELEQSQSSDVSSQESSSETPPQTAENDSRSEASAPEQGSQKDTPFHEHPRWKEMLQQRDQFANQVRELQQKIEGLNRPKEQPQQTQAQAKQMSKFVERAKNIDPEFAQWVEQQESAASSVQQLMQQFQAQAQAAERAQAQTAIQNMHTEHKVPKEWHSFYQNALRSKALDNPNLGVKDIPQMYKEVHQEFSKFLEDYKRKELASYGQSKKADSSVPASAKGAAPKPSNKQQFSKDPEEARGQLVSRIMQNLKQSKDV